MWAQTEGFIPAPETSHGIAVAIQEAKKAKEEDKAKVILLNPSFQTGRFPSRFNLPFRRDSK